MPDLPQSTAPTFAAAVVAKKDLVSGVLMMGVNPSRKMREGL
jgi:hypothetical protein